MKTFIKIVVALLILTAAAQAGMAALTSYQFEDAVHEAMLFAPASTDEELAETIMSLASNQGIPLDADDISIRQVGSDLHVNLTYDTEVALIPGIYTPTFTFNRAATIRLMPGVRRSPSRR
jgi:hypothetical protein